MNSNKRLKSIIVDDEHQESDMLAMGVLSDTDIDKRAINFDNISYQELLNLKITNNRNYFLKNKLDESVVDELYSLPLMYPTPEYEKEKTSNQRVINGYRTIGGMLKWLCTFQEEQEKIDNILKTFKHLNYNDPLPIILSSAKNTLTNLLNYKFIAQSRKSKPIELIGSDYPILANLYNQKIINEIEMRELYENVFPIGGEYCSLESFDSIVSFGKENLKKHFGYTEQQAIEFVSFITNAKKQLGGKSYKLGILKKEKLKNFKSNHQVPIQLFDIELLRIKNELGEDIDSIIWGLTPMLRTLILLGLPAEDDKNELFLSYVKAENLQFKNIETYKRIAESRYLRMHPKEKYKSLPFQIRTQSLVNTIRHTHIYYEPSWRSDIFSSNRNKNHDICFEIALRKIINAFPTLITECQRQLDKRIQ